MLESLKKYTFLLSPINQAALANEIQQMKTVYGQGWLKQFSREFPDFVFIVNLIANHNENDALLLFKEHLKSIVEHTDISELKKHAKIPFLTNFITDDQIKTFAVNQANEMVDDNQTVLVNLHAQLRAEIDKPRF